MPVTVETFTDTDPKGALVIVAFHSTGAAAPIAAAYLRQQVDLPLVGQVTSSDLGPVAHVGEGIATSPVRITGGDMACAVGKGCERVYMVTAELPIPVQLLAEIAAAVLEWAKDAALVLCLDAVVRDKGDPDPDVYAVASDAGSLAMIDGTKTKPLGGGILVGMTGALLVNARSKGARVAAVVVEATRDHPDGRAAAELVKVLDPLLPAIDIDPGPLLKEALELEEKISRSIREAEQARPVKQAHTFI